MKTTQLRLKHSQLVGRPVRAGTKPAAWRPARGMPTRAIAEPPVVPFLKDSVHLKEWSPESWKNYEALQQPNYPDQVSTTPCLRPVGAAA